MYELINTWINKKRYSAGIRVRNSATASLGPASRRRKDIITSQMTSREHHHLRTRSRGASWPTSHAAPAIHMKATPTPLQSTVIKMGLRCSLGRNGFGLASVFDQVRSNGKWNPSQRGKFNQGLSSMACLTVRFGLMWIGKDFAHASCWIAWGLQRDASREKIAKKYL